MTGMPDAGERNAAPKVATGVEHSEEDMKIKRARQIATLGIVGVALTATPIIATTGPAAAKSAPSCQQMTDDHWPAWVQGQPDGIDPHTTAATYMWHDGNGWHIRVTHRGDNRRTFSGQLTTKGDFVNASAVRLEKSDQFQVSSDKHSLTFLFKNYGGIDGVNFHTHCAPSITFAFQSDGKTTKPSHIVIGRNNHHPRNNPFTVTR
jgi:hypothetical protein